ncbi:Signal transduction histidine kinase [bacterium A37T11]|nr:Signal transduction histidine kinase [bacterium A37T11]
MRLSGVFSRMVIYLVSVTFSARAQNDAGLYRDSLLLQLRTMPADTNKVLTLITIGQQYENNLPDSAIYYYEQVHKLSKRLNYPDGFVRYVNNYTAILNMQAKYDQSLTLLQKARDTCVQHHLDGQIWKVLLNIGSLYQYKQEYEKAASYYLASLPMAEKWGSNSQVSLIYGNICGLYRDLERYNKALGYGRQSVAWAEKTQDALTLSSACINLGNVLNNIGQRPEALSYLRKAYRLSKNAGDLALMETSLINIANTYDRSSEASAYLPIYREVLPLARSLEDITSETLALKGIAEALYWLQQYDAAQTTLDTTITFALKNNQRNTAKMMLLLMSDIQIAKGNSKKSVSFRNAYDSLQMAIVNEGMLKNIQELETKYDVQKRKQELLQKDLLLAQGKQAALRQRIGLLLACAGILILALLLYFGYRYYRHRQQLQQKELATLQAEQENVRLKAQLEGQEQERQRISQEIHDDMGSGLTSVMFMSRMVKEPAPIAQKLHLAAKGLLRKMNEIIWTLNASQDTLDSLLAYMRLNLVELLENAGMSYHFDFPENLPNIFVSQQYRRNFYLATAEVINNVLKHAEATDVFITATINSQLEINIKDNGKGFDQRNIHRFGNGLNNLKHRMAQIEGRFAIKSDNVNGTVVRFTAPLNL